MRRLYWTVPFLLGLALAVNFGMGWRQRQEVSIVISRFVAALREGDAARTAKLLVPQGAAELHETLLRDSSAWTASPGLRHRVEAIRQAQSSASAEIVLIDAEVEIPQTVELERLPAGHWRIRGLRDPTKDDSRVQHADVIEPEVAHELGEALNAEPGLLLERTARQQAESLQRSTISQE